MCPEVDRQKMLACILYILYIDLGLECMHCTALQCSAVQCSAVQCSPKQCILTRVGVILMVCKYSSVCSSTYIATCVIMNIQKTKAQHFGFYFPIVFLSNFCGQQHLHIKCLFVQNLVRLTRGIL